MSVTVAMYSHDSVGLGHARRNRALAYALAADLPRLTGESVRGLLIAGHPDATQDSLPVGWDWLVLPGFTRASDGGYASRRLRVSHDRLSVLRSATAEAALEAMQPDLFIVDRHPFGIDGELLPALESVRAAGTRCVLGLREVLDSPQVAAAEWEEIGGAASIAHYYDALWVYGDRKVYDPLATGEIPATLARRTRFAGYLAHGRPEDAPVPAGGSAAGPYVLTMVGGGSDGGRLALAAARAEIPPGHRHVILTGPQMPEEDHQEISSAARDAISQPGDVEVTRYARHVPRLLRDAAAVISMAGYNSVTEIMATTTPALIVPRAGRRAEQPRRAAALAGSGAVDMLEAAHLTPAALSAWLAGAVGRRAMRDRIDLDGLTRIGDLAVEHLATRRPATAGNDARHHRLAERTTAHVSH